MNFLRNLTVFFVDLISYPIGKAIDRSWEHFNFDDKESE